MWAWPEERTGEHAGARGAGMRGGGTGRFPQCRREALCLRVTATGKG